MTAVFWNNDLWLLPSWICLRDWRLSFDGLNFRNTWVFLKDYWCRVRVRNFRGCSVSCPPPDENVRTQRKIQIHNKIFGYTAVRTYKCTDVHTRNARKIIFFYFAVGSFDNHRLDHNKRTINCNAFWSKQQTWEKEKDSSSGNDVGSEYPSISIDNKCAASFHLWESKQS